MSTEPSNFPRLTLIRTQFDRINQPVEEIQEFESAILRQGGCEVVTGLPRLPWFKVTARLVAAGALVLERLLSLARRGGSRTRTYLCIGYIAPHYLAHKTFPYFTLPGARRVVWLYDAWEKDLPEIARTLLRWRIDVAFVSSRQAAEYLNAIPGCTAHWLPEAVTVDVHHSKPWDQRTIDVLQLGRRWDWYHNAIEPICHARGWNYRFEEKPRALVFPTRQGFIDGLADAKISICVPSSITHPERSGAVETMTWRYLQSMASGCLVLGRMPAEMRALFDYEPMLEIDEGDPAGQLAGILAHFDRHIPLLERNLAFARDHHQWPQRWDSLRRALGLSS
jgi:hypothetical protein